MNVGDLHPSLVGNYNQGQRMPSPQSQAAGQVPMVWDATKGFVEATGGNFVERLALQAAQLKQSLEATRLAYNQVIQERDQLHAQATQAESRLGEVQRFVSRYTVVEDPVVASDGFTYERRIIERYLEDCRQSKAEAISQQTKDVMSDVLLSNQSLRKLVELLKTVKPEPVPPLVERHLIPQPHYGGGGGGGPPRGLQINTAPEPAHHNIKSSAIRGANGPDDVYHAADLEAGWANNTRGNAGPGANANNDRGGPRPASGAVPNRGGGNVASPSSPGVPSNDRLHPCIRVYGYCNYKDECTFARYPYDACLNNIKGKCRFGSNCKELHVNPSDPKYRNPMAQQSQGDRGGMERGGMDRGGDRMNSNRGRQ